VTFNHGVEGSSPSALTKQIKHLAKIQNRPKMTCVGTVWANQLAAAVAVCIADSDSNCSDLGVQLGIPSPRGKPA
jgi:hypothetical protein